jgi:hypothetical protein
MYKDQTFKKKYCLLGNEYGYEISKEFEYCESIKIELPPGVIMVTTKIFPSKALKKKIGESFYWTIPISLQILRNGVHIEIFNHDMIFQGNGISQYNVFKPDVNRSSEGDKNTIKIVFYNKGIKKGRL